ncbi:MAG: GTP-binding protein [Candidatus Lokiarchaeota archaeon]|nr:GTP-binding protein [Candidatus Lokiarchaeota archaeon]
MCIKYLRRIHTWSLDGAELAELSGKILLVAGEGGVGKSTLIRYLLDRSYQPQKITVGVNVESCKYDVDGSDIQVTIKDAGGEERFRFMLPMWAKGADGALLVFDLGRFHTFLHVTEWLALMQEHIPTDRILLIGAKSDIGIRRDVDAMEAEKLSEKHNLAGYLETSAKLGEGVDEAFSNLLRIVLEVQSEIPINKV